MLTGNPFAFRVTKPPDPSRVQVGGPGLMPGVIGLFDPSFDVDTREAGNGQLTVRIKGPPPRGME